MIRDTLFSLLAQRLGNRTDLITRMATEVQLLQETKLEGHEWLPWFLETDKTTIDTTANDERIALPVDMLGEIEEEALWVVDSTQEQPLVPLRKMDYDDMIRMYPGTGQPKAYAVGADYIFLGPVPDAVYTITLRYMAKDATLSTNIENKWLKHASDVVIAELGAIMAKQHMQFFELAATFEQDAQKAWNRLYTKHVARQEANHERVMEA